MNLLKLLASVERASTDKAELFDVYHDNFHDLFDYATETKTALHRAEEEVTQLLATIEKNQQLDSKIVVAVKALMEAIKA